jgi:hypothetical protein
MVSRPSARRRGSSLRGEFTRVEMGHMVIASAANGRNR